VLALIVLVVRSRVRSLSLSQGDNATERQSKGVSPVGLAKSISLQMGQIGTDDRICAPYAAGALIWIFDQYFWSRPLAPLLNRRLKEKPNLYAIVVLPPHADSIGGILTSAAHRARVYALQDLVDGLTKSGMAYDRVGVYNLWQGANTPCEVPKFGARRRKPSISRCGSNFGTPQGTKRGTKFGLAGQLRKRKARVCGPFLVAGAGFEPATSGL
jgi:hypothetical protein